LGSFFALSILGITVAGIYSSGRPTALQSSNASHCFRRLFSLAVALLLIPVEYAEWFSVLLKRLGDTLAPLALLSVGLQLRMGMSLNTDAIWRWAGFQTDPGTPVIFLLYVAAARRTWSGDTGHAVRSGDAADDYRSDCGE